jgi:hypothetical protein
MEEIKIDMPRLSIIVHKLQSTIPLNRPFIYEVDNKYVCQFNHEYKGYLIGKLKSMHNHPINLITITKPYEGQSIWYPSIKALYRIHEQAKNVIFFYKWITAITVLLCIGSISYIVSISKKEVYRWNDPIWYVLLVLLLTEFSTIILYGLYNIGYIGHNLHDKEHIINISVNGTTDSFLLDYRKELINAITIANIPDHGDRLYLFEKKYNIEKI